MYYRKLLLFTSLSEGREITPCKESWKENEEDDRQEEPTAVCLNNPSLLLLGSAFPLSVTKGEVQAQWKSWSGICNEMGWVWEDVKEDTTLRRPCQWSKWNTNVWADWKRWLAPNTLSKKGWQVLLLFGNELRYKILKKKTLKNDSSFWIGVTERTEQPLTEVEQSGHGDSEHSFQMYTP